MPKHQVDTQCEHCEGTGLYQGFMEKGSVAVLCNKCNGTGCRTISYKPFKARRRREGITKVFQKNSVFLISEQTRGGVTYKQWLERPDSAGGIGAETRDLFCPLLWYVSVPEWSECVKIGRITECQHFPNKTACWERFDKEASTNQKVSNL